jgi:hypothetical protein
MEDVLFIRGSRVTQILIAQIQLAVNTLSYVSLPLKLLAFRLESYLFKN